MTNGGGEIGVDPAGLGDEDLFRELTSLYRSRLETLRHGPDAALANHFRRTADLETEYMTRYRAARSTPAGSPRPSSRVAWVTVANGIMAGDRRLCTDVGVSSVPGPHH
jgi:hypothetical protein